MEATDQIDRLIERRSRGADPDEKEELWKESVCCYHERRRLEHAAAWRAFHLDQAARIERTAAALASRHQEKAAALVGEPDGA